MAKSKQDKDREFIQLALERFETCVSAEEDNRADMLDDLRFANLDQWPDDVKSDRKGKPMLTLDHIGQHVRQVTGDMKQNKPSIKIRPHDDNTDKETAEIIEGLIRHIESNSEASRAYTTAGVGAVKAGYGIFRIVTEWSEDDVFEQDIKIKRERNPFKWYIDPNAEEFTKHDMNYAIGITTYTNKEYEAKWPGKSTHADFGGIQHGNTRAKWFEKDAIRVAEYYVREEIKKTVCLMSDGNIVNKSDYTKKEIDQLAETGLTVVREREVKSHKVYHYIINANEILEGPTEIPSKWIPVIPVYGEESDIEGKVEYRGIVRAAKDPQRMYNYWRTTAVEILALQPKAPYIGTQAQFADAKDRWETSNKANYAYLPYTPDPRAPGPPQRQAPPNPNPAMFSEAQQAEGDIMSATGLYQSSLNMPSNETSGRAILARERQGDTGTYEYTDNLGSAIEQAGRVIVDMIPRVYDTPRTIRILGEDEVEKVVKVNQQGGKDITVGKYDVKVVVGPSYATKRLEAAESMLGFIQAVPQAGEITGDLVAGSMDWPDAEKFASRLKKVLPPDLVEIDEDDPEAQQKKAQAQQQIQMQQRRDMEAYELEKRGKQAEIDKDRAAAAKSKADAAKIMQEVKTSDENLQKVVNAAVQSALLNMAR